MPVRRICAVEYGKAAGPGGNRHDGYNGDGQRAVHRGPPKPLVLCQVLSRRRKVRPNAVGTARERRDLLEIIPGLRLVAKPVGRLRGADQRVEAGRLLLDW